MAERLNQLGFDETYALVGGLDAWTDEGLPVTQKPGMAELQV